MIHKSTFLGSTPHSHCCSSHCCSSHCCSSDGGDGGGVGTFSTIASVILRTFIFRHLFDPQRPTAKV